jgi:hypothetical protein
MTDPRRYPKSYRRRLSIDGPWVPRSKELLESPAYQVLSRAAHQALSRIEIEHMMHGGFENGKLPVTYDQFVAYGLHRRSIAPALRELEAVRLVEVTERGSSGNGESRRPNKFRLTYLNVGRADPTNEWRHIKAAEARSCVKAARKNQRTPRKKNRTPVAVSADSQWQKVPITSGTNGHWTHNFPSKSPVAESATTSISGLPPGAYSSPPLPPPTAQSSRTSTREPDKLDEADRRADHGDLHDGVLGHVHGALDEVASFDSPSVLP